MSADKESRGYFRKEDVNDYIHLNKDGLIKLSNSEIPKERAIAVSLLTPFNNDNSLTKFLLDKWVSEDKLYVRLEIAKSLENGNIDTARLMSDYILKIPTKQYKKVPSKPYSKKTYVIPRDLICRSLARMDISIFPFILELFDNKEILSEIIDVFGFMVYHNPELDTEDNLEFILSVLEDNKENELIYWKSTMALAGFSSKKAKIILEKIRDTASNEVISKEAERALSL